MKKEKTETTKMMYLGVYISGSAKYHKYIKEVDGKFDIDNESKVYLFKSKITGGGSVGCVIEVESINEGKSVYPKTGVFQYHYSDKDPQFVREMRAKSDIAERDFQAKKDLKKQELSNPLKKTLDDLKSIYKYLSPRERTKFLYMIAEYLQR